MLSVWIINGDHFQNNIFLLLEEENIQSLSYHRRNEYMCVKRK